MNLRWFFRRDLRPRRKNRQRNSRDT